MLLFLKLVKQVVAADVIDYTSVNLCDYLSQNYSASRFDMIVDTIGSYDLYGTSPKFLKDTGDFMPVAIEMTSERRGYMSIFVNLIGALILPAWSGGVPRRFTMAVAEADLKEIGRMIQSKEIKPVLDSVWSFDDEGIKGAYQKLMTGHAAGNVVVKIRD
jgi:NADPH:quinone reductase-like Zn-dependent oxidoreductase